MGPRTWNLNKCLTEMRELVKLKSNSPGKGDSSCKSPGVGAERTSKREEWERRSDLRGSAVKTEMSHYRILSRAATRCDVTFLKNVTPAIASAID